MKATGSRPKLLVGAGGVVGHAGARLLADLAEVTGLERASLSSILSSAKHDPVYFHDVGPQDRAGRVAPRRSASL